MPTRTMAAMCGASDMSDSPLTFTKRAYVPSETNSFGTRSSLEGWFW